jgi:hypothetical protein
MFGLDGLGQAWTAFGMRTTHSPTPRIGSFSVDFFPPSSVPLFLPVFCTPSFFFLRVCFRFQFQRVKGINRKRLVDEIRNKKGSRKGLKKSTAGFQLRE